MMLKPREVYLHCDILNKIPKFNKDNYLYEVKLISKELKENSTVLQVGCMDGTKIKHILKERPDLNITGLEIDSDILKLAEDTFAKNNVTAKLVLGDITQPPKLGQFDYVLCLNNTLGYLKEEQKAIENMKKLGKVIIISVYGEKFTDTLAREYFKSINLKIERIENNVFLFKNFTKVKRYTKEEVHAWGGRTINTPLGYFSIIG